MTKFNLNQLLNEKSKCSAAEESDRLHKKINKIIPISVYDLEPSKDNFYSMEQIQDLKIAIELVGGVKQNLNVTPLGNGKYKVLAGHRRRLASIALVEEGKLEYEFIPCSIEEPEENAELQEIRDEIMLIVTNSQREKTDWDKIEEVKRLKVALERYKKNAKLPGRLREIMAEVLKTSTTQIERRETISKKLTPEFKDELKEGRVNISTAYELSRLSDEQQKESFKEYKQKGKVTINDAKAKKEEKLPAPPADIRPARQENASSNDLDRDYDAEAWRDFKEAGKKRDFADMSAEEKVNSAIDLLDYYRFTIFQPGTDTRLFDFIIVALGYYKDAIVKRKENLPLTLDKLQEMEGEPIWLECEQQNQKEWILLNKVSKAGEERISWRTLGSNGLANITKGTFEKGKHKFYKRKPEREGN